MGMFCTLASGSTGNCSVYCSGGSRILIDAGTTNKNITRCLKELGMTPGELTHILVTHSHSDHIHALPVLLKHTDAPVYCSRLTAAASKIPESRLRPLTLEPAMLGSVRVSPFATDHDAPGSMGFVLGTGAGALGYCTDLGHMEGAILSLMAGCPTVLLESNHDPDMLRTGPYPWALKQRILSDHGHLCNDQCAEAAVELVRGGTRRLILAHLSQHNNTPELALATTLGALKTSGLRAEVSAAPVGMGRPLFWED